MAGHIVVAVDHTALDMDFNIGPFVQLFRLRPGVGRVEHVVERIFRALHNVETLREFHTAFSTRNKAVALAPLKVEGRIVRDISTDKHIEQTAIGIDARWISHIRAARSIQFFVPVVGIAVSLIVVDAEIFLIRRPVFVFHLQGNGNQGIGHTGRLHLGRQLAIVHSRVRTFQLGTGIVGKIVFKLFPNGKNRIDIERIDGFEFTSNSAELRPVGIQKIRHHVSIDIDNGFRGKEVAGNRRHRRRLHIRHLDRRAVESALCEVGHPAADNDGIERLAIGEGIEAQRSDVARYFNFFQARMRKRPFRDRSHRGGQFNVLQISAGIEHIFAQHAVVRHIVFVVGRATRHDAGIRQIERMDLVVVNQRTKEQDIGTVNRPGNFHSLVGCGQHSRQRAGRLQFNSRFRPQRLATRHKTGKSSRNINQILYFHTLR